MDILKDWSGDLDQGSSLKVITLIYRSARP